MSYGNHWKRWLMRSFCSSPQMGISRAGEDGIFAYPGGFPAYRKCYVMAFPGVGRFPPPLSHAFPL